MDFNKADVSRVAKAILDDHILYDQEQGRNSYNECRYCNGHVYWDDDPKDIVHDLNCVVLIAKDLLTGE